MAKVGVIGAGSWGIALAKLLRTNGNEVTVWSIVEEEVAMLRVLWMQKYVFFFTMQLFFDFFSAKDFG